MKKFTDLLVFELNRVKYFYLLLIGLITALQVATIFNVKNNYLWYLEDFQIHNQGNIIDFLEAWGPISFVKVTDHTGYMFSIFLGIMALVIYAFAIWYRDWLGKNNLSYRLLTLPGSRLSIFFAKLATIIFMMFGLLALQLVYMYLGDELLRLLIPTELYVETSIASYITMNPLLLLILPLTILDFILHYSIGIAVLFTVTMFILLELSYKIKGIIMSLAIIAGGLLISYLIVVNRVMDYLFSEEILLFVLLLSLIISGIATFISHKLLEEKVTV